MKLNLCDKEYICAITRYFINDSIDDDLILYDDMSDKIIVLNATSAYIYQELLKSFDVNGGISDFEIATSVVSACKKEDLNFESVLTDIREILMQFIHERIIEIYDNLPA